MSGRLARLVAGGDWTRAAIRIAFVGLSLAAVAWDLPSSFSWENDGVAPRDIFAGIAENLRPGSAFRYPLLHPLALGLLCLPVLLPAALRAPSLRLADLQPAILAPAVMTACALIGRLVAISAALVALAALGRIAGRLAGRRASLWTEAFAAANLSFGYYARATNLDGPALMWTVLSVERLMRVGDGGDGRDLTMGAVFAALAIATKDQAFATYVLIVPFVWVAIGRAREAGIAAPSLAVGARAGGIAAAVYAAASGALFNPTGLATRLRALTGPASGDYRAYTRDSLGLWANLRDLVTAQGELWWPWPIVALAWMGVALALARAAVERGRRAPSGAPVRLLVPLAAGLGCLVGFTLMVGRDEHRFVLPLGFWLSFYVGLALDAAQAQAATRAPALGRVTAGAGMLMLLASLVAPIELVATQWADGRRQVERWLATRPRGTSVETYGPLVYLPRFSSASARALRVARVGPEPLAGRNPQAGMEEQRGRIANLPARRPDVIILSEGFVSPFLKEVAVAGAGRVLPAVVRHAREDVATMEMVHAAVEDRLADYRLCFVAAPHLPPPLSRGGSTEARGRGRGSSRAGRGPRGARRASSRPELFAPPLSQGVAI